MKQILNNIKFCLIYQTEITVFKLWSVPFYFAVKQPAGMPVSLLSGQSVREDWLLVVLIQISQTPIPGKLAG